MRGHRDNEIWKGYEPMATPTLIYCGGGNPRFYRIATEAGFRYGAQLPDTIYGPLYFADQDWKSPKREAYMAGLAEHRPVMATVLDWEYQEQLGEVLDWAEEAAQHVERVVIIPKVMGGIQHIPRRVGSADVVLGYSVPTKYGGTQLPLWSFAGWPVHLLGGSPHKQMHVYAHLRSIAEVVTADGNMMNKMATQRCAFWREKPGSKGKWITLKEADGRSWDWDAPYEAFRRSCENIMAAWQIQDQ